MRVSTLPTRLHLPMLAAMVAATTTCAGAGRSPDDLTPGATGRDASPGSAATLSSQIDRLLEHSAVETITTARAGAFTRRVAYLAEDLTDAELERLVPAVREAFASDALRADIAAYMEREALSEETVAEVVAWLESGASASLEAAVDAYDPPLELEEYARSLLTTPPPDERVLLVVTWAEVQGAGEFYVLLDEALTEGAFRVWGALRADAPKFEPSGGDRLQVRLLDSFNAAVVSFLHSFEAVPDSLLRAATEEYSSPAGQWYVQTYSLAVAEAMRSASTRAADALRRLNPSRSGTPSSWDFVERPRPRSAP